MTRHYELIQQQNLITAQISHGLSMRHKLNEKKNRKKSKSDYLPCQKNFKNLQTRYVCDAQKNSNCHHEPP